MFRTVNMIKMRNISIIQFHKPKPKKKKKRAAYKYFGLELYYINLE